MRRLIVPIVIVTSLASTGCRTRVQYPSAPMQVATIGPVGAQGPVGWADVRQPEAGFACQMPAIPRIETDSGSAEDGATFQTIRVRATAPYGTFGVVATQWEGGVVGDPLSTSRGLVEHVLELTDLPDHRARRVSMPGFYAREDTGRLADGTFFALRQFFGRERIYVAVVTVQSDPTGLRAAEQFMQSIALDRRDALLPMGDGVVPVPLYLPDVDFSVSMPPLASRRAAPIDIEDAGSEAWIFESRHAQRGFYRVTVVEFADGAPDDALDRIAGAFSLGAPGRYVHTSGFPGCTYDPGAGRSVRAFVTASRVYVLEITAADALGADATAAFFDSFRIL